MLTGIDSKPKICYTAIGGNIMAWCPFAIHQPLPENNFQANLNPRAVILHTAVSNAASLFNFFNAAGNGIESHFYIYKDGTIYQYIDTVKTADANLKANGFAISIETWDGGTIVERQPTPWTAEQVESIIKLCRWLNQVHPAIKLQKIPSAYDSGIGYHVQFGSPGPWTPVSKSCPTAARIKQYNEVIIPILEGGGNVAIDERAFEDLAWRVFADVNCDMKQNGGPSKDANIWSSALRHSINEKITAIMNGDDKIRPDAPINANEPVWIVQHLKLMKSDIEDLKLAVAELPSRMAVDINITDNTQK